MSDGSDIAVLKARMDAIDNRFNHLEETLSKILERVTLARGGLAMLIAIGSVCATLAGAVVLWLHGGKAP
jgi:hypothetical protein